MFSRTPRLLSLLFLEFSGFYILFSFQGSLLFLNSNSFILSQLVVFVNNFFIYFLKFFRTSVPLSATRIIISQVFDTVKHFFKFFSIFCTFLFSTFFPGIETSFLLYRSSTSSLVPMHTLIQLYHMNVIFPNPIDIEIILRKPLI